MDDITVKVASNKRDSFKATVRAVNFLEDMTLEDHEKDAQKIWKWLVFYLPSGTLSQLIAIIKRVYSLK